MKTTLVSCIQQHKHKQNILETKHLTLLHYTTHINTNTINLSHEETEQALARRSIVTRENSFLLHPAAN